MGRTVSLFLMRAAGILVAGMLLFAVFNHAHAQTTNNQAGDSYGLKRFPGDNYDSVPPGAGIPAPPAPQGYAPVSGSGVSPSGYYSTLNGGTSQPAEQPVGAYTPLNNGVTPVVTVAPPPNYQAPADPAQGYQPAPGYQPMPAQQPAYQVPTASEPYGYRPLLPVTPAAPQYPQGQIAAASPYAYYQPQAAYASRTGYDYALGPGDKLRLTVYGETDLSGEFTIDGSGFARLPLIGQVRAAGYTSQQLEAVIGSALSQGYLKSPRVSVEVTTYRPFYIIGAVNRPGQYPYVDHMTALNAVALAGGFTSGAVESVVFVRREGSNQEVEVPADRTTEIYPGDVVKVHNTFLTDAMAIFAPFSGVAASAATAAVIQ
jgi:protein involved in polysaccharide export with SLBB domain